MRRHGPLPVSPVCGIAPYLQEERESESEQQKRRKISQCASDSSNSEGDDENDGDGGVVATSILFVRKERN